jgi:hypothetical protein
MTTLRRDLDLTAKQLEDWRRDTPGGPLGAGPSAGIRSARVFELADRSVAEGRPAAATMSGAGDALELRLGAWAVVIRSAHP